MSNLRLMVFHRRIAAPALALALLCTMNNVNAVTGASITGIIVGKAFGSLLGKSAGGLLKSSDADIAAALAKTCDEFNKQLPKTIDENTQLDSISNGPGLRLTYKHTVTVAAPTAALAAHLEQVVGPRLRNSLCSQENILLKNRVSLTYAYYGSDGGYIGHIGVRPEDCGFK